MSFSNPTFPRLTPWVARLIAVTAAIQLLLETIFTSHGIRDALAMNPVGFATHPWGALTYLFVHGGVLHLGTNMLGLYLFGTAVESRMGSRTFLFYYLYCGVGAALFCLLLSLFAAQAPVIGASGAVLGVAVAFAMYWPDAEILFFPIPVPIRARTLVIGLALLNLILARLGSDGIARDAHVGGMLAGWIFFKAQALSRRRPSPLPRQQPERVMMVPQTVAGRDAEPRTGPASRSIASRPGSDPVANEVDRVLDKISAKGIASLTPEERRFLDEVSKRKQREIN
ncbi:MAG TPA: rhomboid family intramembrane serine protease [Gemmatimonadales bacterium]|nr:rhomboid family intramembrane serine protease [Gemmatimonadales bacterium]